MAVELLAEIRDAFARQAYRISAHALEKMAEREIVSTDVEEVVLAEEAEIIEDYPEDPRGASCLVFGWTQARRPLHIQVSYPPDVRVITTYEPDQQQWVDYRIRR
jgi:hypothetical protein